MSVNLESVQMVKSGLHRSFLFSHPVLLFFLLNFILGLLKSTNNIIIGRGHLNELIGIDIFKIGGTGRLGVQCQKRLFDLFFNSGHRELR